MAERAARTAEDGPTPGRESPRSRFSRRARPPARLGALGRRRARDRARPGRGHGRRSPTSSRRWRRSSPAIMAVAGSVLILSMTLGTSVQRSHLGADRPHGPRLPPRADGRDRDDPRLLPRAPPRAPAAGLSQRDDGLPPLVRRLPAVRGRDRRPRPPLPDDPDPPDAGAAPRRRAGAGGRPVSRGAGDGGSSASTPRRAAAPTR